VLRVSGFQHARTVRASYRQTETLTVDIPLCPFACHDKTRPPVTATIAAANYIDA